MRNITEHQINAVNEVLQITATDLVDAGGANFRYEITGLDASDNPSAIATDPTDTLTIIFQNGPVDQVGVNGLTNEILLAILADRLRGFQAGPFACTDNGAALAHVEQAMYWLKHRTGERVARGVEGTHGL